MQQVLSCHRHKVLVHLTSVIGATLQWLQSGLWWCMQCVAVCIFQGQQAVCITAEGPLSTAGGVKELLKLVRKPGVVGKKTEGSE